MTYLSKIDINPQRRRGRMFLANPRVVHAAVMSCFPPADADRGRILWRLDSEGVSHRLYIVSPDRPDMSHIVEQAGWEQAPGMTADYDAMLDALAVGQMWGFRLAANPVKSEPVAGKRGRIVPLAGVAGQTEWLVRRCDELGVSFGDNDPSFILSSDRTASFGRPDPHSDGKRKTVTLRRVQYDGLLTVEDPDKLRRALVGGIGRGKAYGCGLLTLRKPD